jgi:hypothetical protein
MLCLPLKWLDTLSLVLRPLVLLRPIALPLEGVRQDGVSQEYRKGSTPAVVGLGGVSEIACRLLISVDGEITLFILFVMFLRVQQYGLRSYLLLLQGYIDYVSVFFYIQQ